MKSLLRRLFGRTVTRARGVSYAAPLLEPLEGRALMSAATIGSLTLNTPPAGALLPADVAITQSTKLEIQAHNVIQPGGGIASVTFFVDKNNNGTIDGGDVVVGRGARITNTNDWKLDIFASRLGDGTPGTYTILAEAVDIEGGFSTTAPDPSHSITINVVPGPAVSGLTVSNKRLLADEKVKLQASTIAFKSKSTSVEFFVDLNNDQVPQPSESLGVVTKTTGNVWTLGNLPLTLTNGIWTLGSVTFPAGFDPSANSVQFLAVATDKNGNTSAPVRQVTISGVPTTVVTPAAAKVVGPHINSLFFTPHPVIEGQILKPFAVTVTDTYGPMKVFFVIDKNGDGQIDSGDVLLNNPTDASKFGYTLPAGVVDYSGTTTPVLEKNTSLNWVLAKLTTVIDPTTGFAAGENQILVESVARIKPKTAVGAFVTSQTVAGSIFVGAAATDTLVVTPGTVVQGQSVVPTALLGASTGVKTVNFYVDVNNNGQIDSGDFLLNSVPIAVLVRTSATNFYLANIAATTADGFQLGPNQILAQVVKNDGTQVLLPPATVTVTAS